MNANSFFSFLGERLYPAAADTDCIEPTSLILNDDVVMSVAEDQSGSGTSTFEPMNVDEGSKAKTMAAGKMIFVSFHCTR